MRKILFLDIDGVVNCKTTAHRHNGVIGIDPHMAFKVGQIILQTGTEIVLSSTWRLWPETLEEVRRHVYDLAGVTPQHSSRIRGKEIEMWLDAHPEVTRYAILDDDADMLVEQLPNFFRTSWETGITDEIRDQVINHLNK